MFFSMKLVTEVHDDGIYVRFLPFHVMGYKAYLFADIAEAHARAFRPIIEYGGWGIKYGNGGMSYSVSGKEGFKIVLKDKKRF